MTGHVLARLAREAGLESGRALLARHREVAEFVRAEYFRVMGATGAAGGGVSEPAAERFYLVDGPSYLYRAYTRSATSRRRAAAPTNATSG